MTRLAAIATQGASRQVSSIWAPSYTRQFFRLYNLRPTLENPKIGDLTRQGGLRLSGSSIIRFVSFAKVVQWSRVSEPKVPYMKGKSLGPLLARSMDFRTLEEKSWGHSAALLTLAPSPSPYGTPWVPHLPCLGIHYIHYIPYCNNMPTQVDMHHDLLAVLHTWKEQQKMARRSSHHLWARQDSLARKSSVLQFIAIQR